MAKLMFDTDAKELGVEIISEEDFIDRFKRSIKSKVFSQQ